MQRRAECTPPILPGCKAVSYTATELLEAVNTAIYNLLSGKYASQTIAGRSYTVHDLNALRTMRKDLQKEVRAEGSRVRLGDISGV